MSADLEHIIFDRDALEVRTPEQFNRIDIAFLSNDARCYAPSERRANA